MPYYVSFTPIYHSNSEPNVLLFWILKIPDDKIWPQYMLLVQNSYNSNLGIAASLLIARHAEINLHHIRIFVTFTEAAFPSFHKVLPGLL